MLASWGPLAVGRRPIDLVKNSKSQSSSGHTFSRAQPLKTKDSSSDKGGE